MQDISKDTITFRNSVSEKALPVRQYGSFIPGSGTGGAGEHWNGQVQRFAPEGFRLRTHLTERYGAGRLPENHALRDWGCSYEDMEPWYTRAEQLLAVSGQAGLYPFEPPRSTQYPNASSESGTLPPTIRGRGPVQRLPSVSSARGQSQPRVPESGWNRAPRLRILRVL
jgi:choline dehydrogenase-like flavoprotein